MPRSQQPRDGEEIMLRLLLREPKRIVEVGPGDGRWGELLKGRVRKIDAVEAWQDYINRYDLASKYDRVYLSEGSAFPFYSEYDAVILADVLEHFEHDAAVAFVEKLKALNLEIHLSLPTSLCEQDGAFYGNPFESHLYQWTDSEVRALGFTFLHEGTNPNGLVKIGTYAYFPK